MKFLLALAVLTVVCAIPSPRQISAPNEELEQLAPTQRSGRENNQVENAKGASHCILLSELEKSDESDFIDDDDEDEEDSTEKVSLDDLINALHIIRNAIQKKVHNNLSHYKDSEDDINVRSKRAVQEDSANETIADAPQQGNRTIEEPGNNGAHQQNNSAVSNNSKGNDTASDHKPKINITQIIKEIHDKIDNIMAKILQSRLGNSSLSEDKNKIHNNLTHKDSEDNINVRNKRALVHKDSANETTADAPQQSNRTSEAPGNNGSHQQNNSAVSNNSKGNDTASDHKPKMNITQIIKEIHDKIGGIIANILRSKLGNNSLPEGDANTNNTATNTTQQKNNFTEFKPQNGLVENEREEDGEIENAEDNNPQEANDTELPSNKTESDDSSNDLVKVNSSPNIEKVIDNEISNIVPIERSQLSELPQNFQENDESTSEVRVVNPIRWYTRKAMQQPSLSYRNFPHPIAHHY